MNTWQFNGTPKGSMTKEELHNIIIADRKKHDSKINGDSVQLQEDILLLMNKHRTPMRICDIQFYLELPETTRWAISREMKKSIRSGLVIPTDKKHLYWLQYEIIEIDPEFQGFYIQSEIKVIESLLGQFEPRRSELEKFHNIDDIRTLLAWKCVKIKDTLTLIKKNVSMTVPEIECIIPKINNLIHLYRNHPNDVKFKGKEGGMFNEFDREMKFLISKLKNIVKELGGR